MNIPQEQIAAMKPAYWQYWNDDVQKKIDADIEANRKAEGCFIPGAIPAGADVKVEQIRHSYIFGAHIFNFDQLGTDERNRKYKDLYGTLFNSATIAFYWQPFEPEEGKRRFAEAECDTPEFWNSCKDPKTQFNWRRPPTDKVVEFCEKKGIRRHGHPLIWGNSTWHYPKFILDKLPKKVLIDMLTDTRCGANLTMQEASKLEEVCPGFTAYLTKAFDDRIKYIAERYGDRINSWDVCNESACEITCKNYRKDGLMWSCHGGKPMPGDYTWKAFQSAAKYLPACAKLNINDYHMHEDYVLQTKDLLSRGCKIDIMGAQMHLFNPQQCLDIADGTYNSLWPEQEWAKMEMLSRAGLPVHMSELTITAPNNDARGQAIQAVIARNLYRLWFSAKCTMGITWWNVVDDCGAPGEPSVSGLFSRDMEPKPAYFALNDLINEQWKTRTCVKAGKDGSVSFRGFRGTYRLTWLDAAGKEQTTDVILN